MLLLYLWNNTELIIAHSIDHSKLFTLCYCQTLQITNKISGIRIVEMRRRIPMESGKELTMEMAKTSKNKEEEEGNKTQV